MLFAKALHKGNFVNEIFSGNFTNDLNSENKPDTQLLVVNESSLEIYNYFYDIQMKLPIFESKINQELFLQIIDAKIFTIKNLETSLVVLLTTCGLLIMKYSKENNLFIPVCSEILNINCEERDKLMYIKIEER